MKTLVALTLCSLVAGCVAPEVDQAALERSPDLELCQVYSMAVDGFRPDMPDLKEKTLSELIKRKSLSQRDVDDIKAEVIRIGMSEHAAICAWGPYSDVNDTVGSWGRHRQFVIGQYGTYIYTENGEVTSWQQ